MSETAVEAAAAFEAEAGITPSVVNAQENAPAATQKFYTEDDLAKVRSQEKSKVYPELQSVKEELAALKREREEEAARKAEAAAAQAAEHEAKQKAKLEEELSAKDLLKLKEQEWNDQIAQVRQEALAAQALVEKERSYAELQAYKQNLIETERDNVMPQMLGFLRGNTPEELQASMEDLKAQTASIVNDVQAANQQTRKEQRGVSVTAPSSGPLEINSENRQFTAADIAAMSVEDYAKNRSRLLSPGAQGKTKGLFG
jgi:hypothetical protein